MNSLPQHDTGLSLEPDWSFQMDTANVASKEIDGEALIINVSNGMYYSLDGVGAAAWELLAAGYPLRSVAAHLVVTFQVDQAAALADVIELASRLVDEKLVSVATPGSAPGHGPTVQAGDRRPYVKPMLNTYSDMADLLALDPPMPGLSQDSWLTSDEG